MHTSYIVLSIPSGFACCYPVVVLVGGNHRVATMGFATQTFKQIFTVPGANGGSTPPTVSFQVKLSHTLSVSLSLSLCLTL